MFQAGVGGAGMSEVVGKFFLFALDFVYRRVSVLRCVTGPYRGAEERSREERAGLAVRHAT